jgi:hypothetical protein
MLGHYQVLRLSCLGSATYLQTKKEFNPFHSFLLAAKGIAFAKLTLRPGARVKLSMQKYFTGIHFFIVLENIY